MTTANLSGAALREHAKLMMGSAHALAAREGDVLSAVIVSQMEAKEESQGGPLKVFQAILKTYGDDAGTFPKPDVEEGNNPSKFKVTTTRGDKDVTVTFDWYKEFFLSTKEGKSLMQERDWLAEMGKENPDMSGIPAKYAKAYDTTKTRKERMGYVTGRIQTGTGAYKRAIRLAYQLTAAIECSNIHVGIAGVQCDNKLELLTAFSTGELYNTTKPFYIRDLKDGARADVFSIGTFMNIDFDAADKAGGGFDAVKETLKREKKEGTSETAPQLVDTVDKFFARMLDLHGFADDKLNVPNSQALASIVKTLNTRNDDGDRALATVWEMHAALGDILGKVPKAGDRYMAFVAKSDDAESKAA